MTACVYSGRISETVIPMASPSTMQSRTDSEAATASGADRQTNEARQGETGHNVRYVLLLSLGGALVVLAAAWLLVT